MADLSLTSNNYQGQSPFDSIRHEDADGEFWLGRELKNLLGYAEWRKFCDAVDRAKLSLEANGDKPSNHIVGADKMIETGKGAHRRVLDYRLTRFACYMVAMNGDPRKSEIAQAQSYFAIKTREAETIIPAQSDRILELQLENENLRLKSDIATLHGKEFAAMAMGGGVIHVEVPVTEIVEPETGKSTRILSAAQLKQIVKERTGQNLPSLKWFADVLRAEGRDDLLIAVTRHSTSEYPIPAKLDEAIAVVYAKKKQRLIGE